MAYKYKCPTKLGYEKVKLTKEEKKELNIRSSWKVKKEFYKCNSHILIHEFDSVYVIMLNILLLPIVIIINMLKKLIELYVDMYEEFVGMIFPKKFGSFTSDRIYLNKEKSLRIDKEDFKSKLNK